MVHPDYEQPSTRKIVIFAGVLLCAALASGAAFAAWLNHGDAIFLSVIQSGLAWCM